LDMSRRFLLIGLAVVLSCMLLLWLVQLGMDWDYARKARAVSDEEMSELMAGKHGPAVNVPVSIERLDPKRQIRLAIGSIGLTSLEESDRVSDLTLTELRDAKGLELVERQALDKALNELSMSAFGLVRAKDAVRIGKLVRADWFLLGSPLRVNETNFVVVRIVDARTGVLREAAVFPANQSAVQLATDLANFVLWCRQHASEAKVPVFLSIGTFQDLSLNNRQADLPTQLRSYLTAAFGKGQFTLLEREFASALFREMQLDLAGLTEEASGSTTPMQSAYWMVDGYYQSYETSQFEIELELTVRRMFGRSRNVSLREKPGEALFQRVKKSIEDVVATDQAALFPSRMTELRAQLSTGQRLVHSVKDCMAAHAIGSWIRYTGRMSVSEVARHRRNAEEAMRALQTALLLDPGNRQAKLLLGDCLGTPFMGQFEEGRELYREIVEADASDELARQTRSKLRGSFWMESSVVRRHWFADAVERSTNSTAKGFFEQQLKVAAEDVVLANRGTPEAERIAEHRLFHAMEAWAANVRSRAYIIDFDNTGLGKYVNVFGTNSSLAARKLVALLPRLQATSTNLAPHIFAGVVTFQVDTNAPIIAEFEQMLDEFAERPPQTPELRYYVQLLGSPVYRWAERKRLYRLAAKLKEINLQMENRERGVPSSEDDWLKLAFNYTRAEEWQKALEIFQSYSNRPVRMGGSGIWGRAFTVVLPGKEADVCREKLGLPALKNPNEFELGKPWMCLHEPNDEERGEPAFFLPDSDAVWVASGNRLIRVGLDGQTNLIVRLPNDSAPVTSLAMSDSTLWVGTAGDGLIEVDKSNSKCIRLSTKDGLAMDEITALQLAGKTLWIGYGNGSRGGLSRLDVTSRKVVSFTPSLTESATGQPPGRPVEEIMCAPDGDIWFLVGGTLGLHRVISGAWEYFARSHSVYVRSLVMDETQIIEGLKIPLTTVTIESRAGAAETNAAKPVTQTFTYEGLAHFEQSLRTNRGGMRIVARSGVSDLARGGLATRSLNDGQVRPLIEPKGIPHPPSTMLLIGRDLWLGGLGYVAMVNLEENMVSRISYVSATSVDQLCLAGGFLWAKFDRHIYRIAELQ
jgi:tetratricopeptide (TPR) repeat protein